MTASIFVIMSSSPVLRPSRCRRVRMPQQLAASLYADASQSYSPSSCGRDPVPVPCPPPDTGDEHNPRPPHCNVHGSHTEIETIYRSEEHTSELQSLRH